MKNFKKCAALHTKRKRVRTTIGMYLFLVFLPIVGMYLRKGKTMKTKLKLLCGALSLALLLTACGNKAGTPAPSGSQTPSESQTPSGSQAPDPAPEEEPRVLGGNVTITGSAEAEALTDAILEPGTVLNAANCAFMLTYIPETDDEDAAEETITGWGEVNGYVPITQQGDGTHIYAVGLYDDKVSAVVLGEEGTFQPGVEAGQQGQTRRFAQQNIIWTAENVNGWKVLVVDEQDYYEENGEQYPCYMMALAPAG